jgi:Disulphide bond corrector protein DsbC
VRVRLMPGYHMNSNKPMDEYLIPLRLTWTTPPVEVVRTDYPEGKLEKYSFSEKPLSVLTGDFDIITEFKASATAPVGSQILTGKLRYQACDNRACYPPRTIEVKLTVDVQ